MTDTPTVSTAATTILRAIFVLLFAAAAAAQGAVAVPVPVERRAIGSAIDAGTLADLPLGNNVYSLLETVQPEVIADRFNSAGLNTGEAARVGGFLGSWRQTLFRIGDVDITDPVRGGSPLVFPELLFWQGVTVATGLMPADLNAAGLAAILDPRLPTMRWTSTVQTFGSGGSLAGSTPSGLAPPLARLDQWTHAAVFFGGPLSKNPIPADVQQLTDVRLPARWSLMAGGSWTRAAKFVRELTPASDSDLASGFAHLVYAPSLLNEWRTLGWVQGSQVPSEYRRVLPADASTRDTAMHAQSTWEHREPAGLKWRVLGALTARSRTGDTGGASSITADRLLDGPMPEIVAATGDSTTRRWTFAARGATDPRDSRHSLEFGANFDHASVGIADQFTGSVGELVDDKPARLWTFAHPDATSRRHSRTVSAFASDDIALSPRLALSAAIRFEAVSGGADGGATGVSWLTWLPRAVLSWNFTGRTRFVAGYRRAANQLTLDLLSYGDPNAPTASVARWSGGSAATGPVIDFVGPGTGGNPSFSRIDPDLKRPYTDEFSVGIQSRRREWLNLGLTGVARREAHLVGAIDTGVGITSFTTIGIADPGLDFFSEADDQTLTVYNRMPSTYGRNQYVLTNPDQEAATAYALMLTATGATDRLFVLFGATASMANGSAGNRGYGPLENDQDATGELFTNPNAATHARGRLFSDRAFTIKWTTVYRFPGDLHVGAIARYQDGQPDARLVIAPDLNQGAEAIRAFPNGKNRFTFTGTLDLRVQKHFTIGPSHLAAIVDFYNLATRSNEVDEYVVTGPDFRTSTAIEPARSIHLGLRLTF